MTDNNRWTIASIEAANRGAGLHFFDADAKRFFRSRILSKVHQGPGGVYFVTSEQFEFGGEVDARKYTVTRFDTVTGGTIRVDLPAGKDGFQAFATSRAAHAYAAELAKRSA